jgi:2-methylisocitrate lyase-like PEP mutase family enzyme
MVQKIRAAASARVDPDFVIKSRTDVLATPRPSRKRSGA